MDIIGDPNQLPPIGRGKVFSDTIEWLKEKHPENIGVLTDNIRQLVNTVEGNGNGILELADIFIQEHQQSSDPEGVPEMKAKKEALFERLQIDGNGDIDKDLGIYYWNEQEELESLLTNVMIRDMHQYTGIDPSQGVDKLWQEMIRDKHDRNKSNPEVVQVISPYRGEFYGTGSINLLMQKNRPKNP